MIDLKFTGPCENCEHRELYLEETALYADYLEKGRFVTHEPHCRHEAVCKKWQKSYISGLEKDTLIVQVDDIDAVNRVIIESGQLCRIFHEDGKDD